MMRSRRPGRLEGSLLGIPGRRGSFGLSFAAALLLLAACRPAVAPAVPRAPAVRDAAAEAFLDDLEERTFRWFWDLADPVTTLIPDRAPTPSFSSVAAVGFGLTAYTIGAERGWVARAEAAGRAARTLRFLLDAPQGGLAEGETGFHGLYYHFLDMNTGRRFETVELSTIDTAL